MSIDRAQDIHIPQIDEMNQLITLWKNGNYNSAFDLISAATDTNTKIFTPLYIQQIINSILSLENSVNNSISVYLSGLLGTFNIKIENFILMGNFSESIVYTLGNFVLYNGEYYLCINENTPVGTLPTNTTYWIILNVSGEQGAPGLGVNYIGTWNSAYSYQVNDVVVYNNILYVCKVANQGTIPSSSTANWLVGMTITPGKIYTGVSVGQLKSGEVWFKYL